MPERLAVVQGPSAGKGVGGVRRPGAGALEGGLLGDEGQDPGVAALRVSGRGAQFRGGGAPVPLVVDGDDPVALGGVGRGGDGGGAPASVGQPGPGDGRGPGIGVVGPELGRARALGVGGGRRLPAGGASGNGLDTPAVPVEDLGGDSAPVEPVAVGDGSTEGTGHLDSGPDGPVGEVVAVHAAQVGDGLLGLGSFAGRAVAGRGGHEPVAAELVPGTGLGVGELRVVAVPGRAPVVRVLGDPRDRGARNEVLLGDRAHERLVEPVVDRILGGLVGQVPLHRHAGHLVAVGGGRHVVAHPGALGLGVQDVDASAGLGDDLLETRAHEHRRGRDEAVDPVGHHPVAEGHRRGVQRALAVGAGAPHRVQLQGPLGAVARVGHRLVQCPGVDLAVGGVDLHQGGDGGKALGGEVGRRVVGALARARADLVDRHVGPRIRVGSRALVLGAADRLGRGAAFLDPEDDLRGGVQGAAGAELLVQALAVADLAQVPGPLVVGGCAVAVVLGATAAVAVVLDGVLVGGQAAAGVDDVVELPAPGHLAPGAVAVGGTVAGVAGLGRVDRRGAHGVRGRVAAVAAGKVVAAEVVLGPVGSGDPPVLHVAVVDVLGRPRGAGELFDLGTVVVLQVPHAGGVVTDQHSGVGAQREDRVLAAPALVSRVGYAGPVAGLVGALDEARLVVPAVADPGGLRVRGGGLPVDGRGVVAQLHVRCLAAQGGGCLQGVAVGEVADVRAGLPGGGRCERGRGVGAARSGRRGRSTEHHGLARAACGGGGNGRGVEGGVGGLHCSAAALGRRWGRGKDDVGGDPALAVGDRRDGCLGAALGAFGGRQRTGRQRHEPGAVGPPRRLQGLEVQGDAHGAPVARTGRFGVRQADEGGGDACCPALVLPDHLDGDLVGALLTGRAGSDGDGQTAGPGAGGAAGGG